MLERPVKSLFYTLSIDHSNMFTQRSPNSEALSDDVLGSIFTLAGTTEGPSVTLVCKRWRQVYYSEPALWRSFTLAPKGAVTPAAAVLAGKHAVLRRVGGMVQHLVVSDSWRFIDGSVVADARWQLDGSIGGESAPSLASCLALLQHGTLTRLDLKAGSQPLPAPALQQVQRFTVLQDLQIKAGSLPEELPAALRQLTNLRSLKLSETTTRRPLQLPHPSSFPALQTFHFCSTYSVEFAGALFTSCTLSRGVESDEDRKGYEDGCTTAGDGPRLELEGVEELPSLRALLDALVPRHVSLDSLALDGWAYLTAAVVAGCEPHLAALAGLELYCGYDLEVTEAALESLLGQAPRLERLSLDHTLQGALPACVVQRAGLRSLRLVDNNLSALPAGPYLAGLTSLRFTERESEWVDLPDEVPPALAAATALQELTVMARTVSEAGVELLGRMTHLRILSVMLLQKPRDLLYVLERKLPRTCLEIWGREAFF